LFIVLFQAYAMLSYDKMTTLSVGSQDQLDGMGKEVLSKAKILIVETSFEILYETQPLFDAIYDMLKQMQFSYKGNLDQLQSPIDGRVLQSDSIFVRESK